MGRRGTGAGAAESRVRKRGESERAALAKSTEGRGTDSEHGTIPSRMAYLLDVCFGVYFLFLAKKVQIESLLEMLLEGLRYSRNQEFDFSSKLI
jgi:hypothetical protein